MAAAPEPLPELQEAAARGDDAASLEASVDLSTVNEYFLAPEDDELSYAELQRHQRGTTFSRAQVQRLHRRFARLSEGSESVGAERILAVLPHSLRDGYVLQRLLRVFGGERRELDFAGFVALMAPFEQACAPEAQRALLLRLYDVDGDGRVGADDLRTFLRNLSPEMPQACLDQVVNATFAELDADRDGFLSLEDLTACGSGAEHLELLSLPMPSVPY
eukprot:Rhum_TRINITY_DN16838_c0_g1::Rhum_TRINITY_DN16838_c0_g1_i1::g.164601::m.164601/K06268/PPP3R, CNB; serine/threonine-protein phosphatase 2B regulatory subunit